MDVSETGVVVVVVTAGVVVAAVVAVTFIAVVVDGQLGVVDGNGTTTDNAGHAVKFFLRHVVQFVNCFPNLRSATPFVYVQQPLYCVLLPTSKDVQLSRRQQTSRHDATSYVPSFSPLLPWRLCALYSYPSGHAEAEHASGVSFLMHEVQFAN